jgi:hypothetical protein
LTFSKEEKKRYSKPLISVAEGAKGVISSVVATPAAGGEILKFPSKGISSQGQVTVNGMQALGWSISK